MAMALRVMAQLERIARGSFALGTLSFFLLSMLSATAFAAATPWVELKVSNGHILMPTRVGGVEGYSILDTGAQLSGISQRFIEQHDLQLTNGQSIQVRGLHGAEPRRTYRDIPVGLLGTEMTFQSAVEIDLGSDFQLLMGADFLSLMVFQFDYPNQRMRAISRDAIDLKKLKNVESRRDKATGQPIVKVNLNGEVDVWLVNDTGNAFGILLKRPVATRRNWLEEFDVTPIMSRGVNSVEGMEAFRLPVVSIGPFDVKNTRVAVPTRGRKFSFFEANRSRSTARSKSQGILGYDVFKNFLVTIDYKTGAMHLDIPPPQNK